MNTKKKHRFNIVDVFIIFIIIAIVGVMYYFTIARNSVVTNSEVLVDYTIELKTVRADHVDKILKCGKVVETVRDQQIGEVVDVAVAPAYNIVTNNDTGERYVQTYPALNQSLDDLIETVEEGAEIPDVQSTDDTEELIYDYYNVKVTIRDKVKKTEKGYSVNGFNIIVGDIVHFRVPEYVNSGYCVKIVEVNE